MSVAGIDVGDSTSCIALARKGGVDVLLNKESKRETPSVISFTSKMRLMGTDAVGSMSTNPRNTVSQLKRLIGKKFNDPHVQKDLEYFPFEVSAGPNGECVYNVTYLDKPAQFTAEQLMAMLLVDLKSIAETDSGAPVTDAVLAVPTYFTEPERHAMLGATQLAGLNCLRLLNETTATALSYGIYKTDLPEGDPVHVVFVDIGFSSTQVCVVALKKGQLQVLSNAWDRDLGGRDLDAVLFEHFVTEFKERYKIDVKTQPRACHRLRMGCEKVKKILTTNSEAPLNVECLMNDIDAHGMITREVFEEEAKPVLDRLLAPVQKVLDSFPYGVQFSWEKEGQAVTSVVFERGSLVPSAKMLTFYRSEPFAIRAEYTPDSDIPATADRSIGSFDIGPFTVPAGADKAKLKVKVMLNLNGVVVVEHAQMIEEEEVEEDAPAAAAPAAADQPMADADADKAAAGGDAAAAGGEAAANGEAPMATDAAPAKVTKKKVKKHAVPVASHTAALSSEQMAKLYEIEVELALQARVQNETNDAKNALEAYIYSLRNKLYDALSPFIREEAKTQLLEKLENLEGFLAALNEPRTAHLEEADKQTVAGECQSALDWLSEKEALQQQTAKYDDPVLLAADVEKKEGTVRRVCEPILSKKPPPPPKKEEPAPQAAEEAGGEEMETEAGPPPPPAAEGQPSDESEPMEA
ncbi:hypothetical protein COHA_009383 [Chlorella ohadii]|uniref:Uncharacterized protein n=1 Tax=Chlorella ohadii TaxID=2649997 RepID=A0AAD5DJK2_9CHLO|nr:hypothetical protein COHA_009383 [Chlorella ohadii]